MSVERETLTTSGTVTTNDDIRALALSGNIAALEAKIVEVLDRGWTNDRLYVKLPPGIYGEWVNDDAMEINRMRMLGFEEDRTYAKGRSTHDTGDGVSRVGDVIFMTCPQIVKDTIEKVKEKHRQAIHNPKKVEKDYDTTVKQHDPAQKVKAFDEVSNANAEIPVDKAGILTAVGLNTPPGVSSHP